jgi:DNA-directed RNA polymerase subunit M/transcription elongation factor TFIIS
MSIRDHIRGILTKQLQSHVDQQMIESIEKGIYNASIDSATEHGIKKHWENPEFAEIYKSIARKTLTNVDPGSYVGNKRLIERLRDGEFPATELAYKTSAELFPEHWQALANEQTKRENVMMEGDKEGGSDMFKCKRCGKSKTKYWEMQTRSADEPMTIFIRCLNCGKEWRQ